MTKIISRKQNSDNTVKSGVVVNGNNEVHYRRSGNIALIRFACTNIEPNKWVDIATLPFKGFNFPYTIGIGADNKNNASAIIKEDGTVSIYHISDINKDCYSSFTTIVYD